MNTPTPPPRSCVFGRNPPPRIPHVDMNDAQRACHGPGLRYACSRPASPCDCHSVVRILSSHASAELHATHTVSPSSGDTMYPASRHLRAWCESPPTDETIHGMYVLYSIVQYALSIYVHTSYAAHAGEGGIIHTMVWSCLG